MDPLVNGPTASLFAGLGVALALGIGFSSCSHGRVQPTQGLAQNLDVPPAPPAGGPEPAPAGETLARDDDAAAGSDNPTSGASSHLGWSREEVSAFHLVEAVSAAQASMPRKQPLAQLAAAAPGPAAAAALRRGGTVAFDGYCYRMALADARGRPVADDADGVGRQRQFALYAWPRNGIGRVFCGFSRGVLCALHGGAYVGPGCGPALDAALSPDADPTLAAGLRGPGVGRDGLAWEAIDPPGPESEVRIRVLDEDEKHLPRFPVMIAPESWFGDGPSSPMAGRRVPLPPRRLPLGKGQSAADGRIAIRGLTAPGLSLFTPHQASSIEVRENAEGIVLVVKGETLSAAQMRTNEARAVSTLQSIVAAQAQLRRRVAIDTDGDGVGEYAFLPELLGARPLREGRNGARGELRHATLEDLPAMSPARGSLFTSEGYVFQVWLPGASSQPVCDTADADAKAPFVDPDLSEVAWIAYAWPEAYDRTGRKAFAATAQGDVFESTNESTVYSGPGRTPTPTAAIPPPYTDDPFRYPWTTPQEGSDGNEWRTAR